MWVMLLAQAATRKRVHCRQKPNMCRLAELVLKQLWTFTLRLRLALRIEFPHLKTPLLILACGASRGAVST